MNEDQLDDVGWTPDQWTALNEQARHVVTAQAKLRLLIPAGPEMPNAYVAQTPPLAGNPLASDTEVPTRPVVRLRFNFVVKAEQLHDVALVRRLVDRAGRRVAAAEDAVLMYGGRANLGAYDVNVRGLPNDAPGLATQAGGAAPPVPDGPYVSLDGLVAATGALRTRGWHGPFNAALDVEYWNALAGSFAGSNTDGFRRASRILGSRQDSRLGVAPALPGANDPLAVVFEPSASVVDLVTVHPPRLSHVQMNGGDVILRVEEAFVLRLFDPEGVQAVTSCSKPPMTCQEQEDRERALYGVDEE